MFNDLHYHFGLTINLSKSIVSSISSDAEFAEHVANELRCRTGSFLMKYLGLPIGGRLINFLSWDHVLDIFKGRLAQWQTRHLSLEGRLTLIKLVLNSIPIHTLSVRLLPDGVHNKLHSIMSNFLWGGSENSRKLHLVD